jgi:hypothetical protein
MGTVRTVSGGRVMTDFNHPLSGKDVVYEIKINKMVADKKIQIDALMKLLLGVKDAQITIHEDNAKILLKAELPKQVAEELAKKIEEYFKLPEAKRKQMSENCRAIAMEEYSQEKQAQAYIELYKRILKSTTN